MSALNHFLQAHAILVPSYSSSCSHSDNFKWIVTTLGKREKWHRVWLTCVAAFHPLPQKNRVWMKMGAVSLNKRQGASAWLHALNSQSDAGGRKRESARRGGLSLYPHSLVQEANTSWHPWNPFLICWVKVMGRGRKWGREGEKGDWRSFLCTKSTPV